MNVLVTGAAGFLGQGVIRALQDAGHCPLGLDIRRDPLVDVEADIRHPEACRRALAQLPPIDAVVHAAALAHVNRVDRNLCMAINVDGTRHMLQAAREAGVTRFVYVSSVTVYGDYDLAVPVDESSPWQPAGLYGTSKRDAESAVHAGGLPQTWTLRLATMYSAGWTLNIRKRVLDPLFGRAYLRLGTQQPRYSLCSRENAAAAVVWAIDGRLASGTYNVADDHVYSQDEIRRGVEAIEGHRPVIPVPLAFGHAAGWLARSTSVPFIAGPAGRSRHRKFFEANVYSTARLRGTGFLAPPHLLEY